MVVALGGRRRNNALGRPAWNLQGGGFIPGGPEIAIDRRMDVPPSAGRAARPPGLSMLARSWQADCRRGDSRPALHRGNLDDYTRPHKAAP